MMKTTTIAKVIGLAFAAMATLAHADESSVKKSVNDVFGPNQVVSVQRIDSPIVYEVVIGKGEIVYANENGDILFNGDMYEAKTRTDLTEIRKQLLQKIDTSKLPLELAIKEVSGDGSRVVYTFEDPNCGWCKKLRANFKVVTNYTHYTFLTPVLGQDSINKTRDIWCADNKAEALEAYHQTRMTTQAPATCEAPIGQLAQLHKRFEVQGTPIIIYEDGTKSPGYVMVDELERRMRRATTVTKDNSPQKVGTKPKPGK